MKQSGLERSDIFITTKILSAAGSIEKTYQKLLDSVHKIDGKDGYVDLFLIHTPSGGSRARREMWQALERLLEDGKTRSIGVSNWGIGHIRELKSFAKVYPPQVNQIEVYSFHYIFWAILMLCSFIRSVNNEKLLNSATRMALSWKHIVHWFEIRREMIQHSARLRRHMARQWLRY